MAIAGFTMISPKQVFSLDMIMKVVLLLHYLAITYSLMIDVEITSVKSIMGPIIGHAMNKNQTSDKSHDYS